MFTFFSVLKNILSNNNTDTVDFENEDFFDLAEQLGNGGII